jgi:DNA processing protein
LACLRLIRSENVGPVTFRQLINHFGGARRVLEALPDLARRAGRRKIRICPQDTAEAELDAASRIQVEPLFTIEPGYPAPLAAVDHPPPMICARGRVELLNKPGIGIVGCRDCSTAGHAFARQLAGALSEARLVVISELARGIDGAAHEASIETDTIAMVVGGLDVHYPPEHSALQRRIGESGCLVSEMPPGFRPRANDFSCRNWIISGISYGVVIVEAARHSGTLITARLANEQGRQGFAVPWHPLAPPADGTNRLIKSGATMITEASDILEAIRPMLPTTTPTPTVRATRRPSAAVAPAASSSTTDTERRIIEQALGPSPVHTDDLLRSTMFSAQSVQIALLELSLAVRLEHHDAHLVSLQTPLK